MNRRGVLRSMGVLGAVGAGACAGVTSRDVRTRRGGGAVRSGDGAGGSGDGAGGSGDGAGDYETVHVPGDRPTVQAGVDAAGGGDLVLVEGGTYRENVEIATAGITLRGRDRNAVVLDGGFEEGHGVHVEADRVAVENLTVRHYGDNAVYWSDVEGFRGSYLTAYNNGYYGVYAYRSTDGRFELSHASGHPDAGFYLGRNQPLEATVAGVVAEYNGVGYSGTSTGAGLTVRDSVWRHNMAGIVPNTLDTVDPPQHSTRVLGNVVYGNDNEDAPGVDHAYPVFGTGIALWGGSDNVVADNVVDGHANFGIAAHHNVVEPAGNVVGENLVRASGRADIALGRPAGEGNQFEGNQFARSLPPDLQADATGGSRRVAAVYESQERRAESGDYPSGDWRDQPEPGPRPTMRDPEAAPRPASRAGSWAR